MVDYMPGKGIRQFPDLGSGLPNMASTHQVAHRVAPDARVVYVDIDPMVPTHAAALMAGPGVVTLRADLREPDQVLGNEQVRDLLDFEQPIAVLGVGYRSVSQVAISACANIGGPNVSAPCQCRVGVRSRDHAVVVPLQPGGEFAGEWLRQRMACWNREFRLSTMF